MTKTDDGGPAFPMPSGDEPRGKRTTRYNEGMSLLDYFAGQALVGLVIVLRSDMSTSDCAQHAYAFAAAVVAERKRLMGG